MSEENTLGCNSSEEAGMIAQRFIEETMPNYIIEKLVHATHVSASSFEADGIPCKEDFYSVLLVARERVPTEASSLFSKHEIAIKVGVDTKHCEEIRLF